MIADHPSTPSRTTRRREWLLFLFLIIVLFPLVTLIAVGGYGVAVWLLQLVLESPGA